MNYGSLINNTKKILSYSDTKNNVITNNLSNINNPYYKRKYMEKLSFEDTMNDTLKRTNEKHFSGKSENIENGFTIKTELSDGRNDMNNVNLDKEIIDLTSNQYLFQMSSTILQKEFTKLKDSII